MQPVKGGAPSRDNMVLGGIIRALQPSSGLAKLVMKRAQCDSILGGVKEKPMVSGSSCLGNATGD